MVKYTDKGTARQHLTDRLMESALNNVGIKADAGEVFRDIAENRLPVWIDELTAADVVEVKHGHWINVNGDATAFRCSVCGETSCCNAAYCNECGARMDLDEVTEE